MSAPRIIMLAGHGTSTAIVGNALAAAGYPPTTVILEDPLPHRQLLARRVKKLGLRTVAGQVAFQTVVVPALRRLAKARSAAILAQADLDPAPIDPARIIRVPSVNASVTIARLRELQPALVIVNGTRILARSVLQTISAPIINMHAGITPLYRGVHGGYWALVEGRRDACGVTVHRVDAGIDTGAILGQALIDPQREDSFVTYPLLQLAAGIPILVAQAGALLEGRESSCEPPAGPSRLWSHPTIWGYAWHRARAGVR